MTPSRELGGRKSPRRWPTPLYEIRVTLHAPLPFAFRWCTDFSEIDPRLAGYTGLRRPLIRTRRQRVYEDLYDESTGWDWIRWVATLHPPNRWHLDGIGNRGDWTVDYQLEPLDPARTRLTLRGRRRATHIGEANPPKADLERAVAAMWVRFDRALQRDYRRAHR